MKRSAGASPPLEVVRNPEKFPDYTVRTTLDAHDATIVTVAPFRSCLGTVVVKSRSFAGAETQTHQATAFSDTSEHVYWC